ncbi:30S ribosomal protein S15 [Chitinivibrio alkaliphilus]|uniref:Small ribosomal subunit protein uS15 n=1 Tax=Chitinivibrio alkaliphilus ACht1 TaxID=1313304 RepID=U7D761_9BACT|nr:30S ribosomal protein S15 [Chitinivibrio alkaliphilus]ERP31783.1 30S ribosomal protein S15P [Chitinivibrio alkaliphilus ACht1]
MSITTEKKAELIREFGAGEADSGNACVQVAILTERIKNLTGHVKANKKDHDTRRSLMMLIGKRKRLLKYLREREIETYRELLKRLNLKR